ncbi:MAG: methyltransferase domain-containing protein [Chitinophagaceae bacterium]|jgi:ubiquinone/menaquinone biosynthesis C-methylase UbiE|nr:methyltransferase domain-containing protein [Chitinophagaceae bacterium]OQY94364.1 MAG: SAM-dependent methyltransferase [Sphingobacteriales bacterium UTBCD1]
MSNKTINTEQGHWLLAKMGKRVLRPGGKELTLKLINSLDITKEDKVVEFAPGMGYTASLLIERKPRSYTGIELNEEAAGLLQKKINNNGYCVVNTSAADTGLAGFSVDKVVGEAMLTMQPDHRKSEIIREAYRILRPKGLYGIHELGLTPESIDAGVKEEVQKSLAKAIKVNARPLTKSEWCTLLEKEGFKIKSVEENPMYLLKWKRMIADEGFFRTLKIGFNILTHPDAKRKILDMRNTFNRYEKQLTSFAIIAEKN